MSARGTELLALAAMFAALGATGASPSDLCTHASGQGLKCGVATARFPECPACAAAAVGTDGFDFWWNWDTRPKVDFSGLGASTQKAVESAFTPMLWGSMNPPLTGWGFLTAGYSGHVLGFNEPDQYGPACASDPGQPAPYGCESGEYRPATSAGWAPMFDPAKAAPTWQQLINAMSAQPNQKQKIVSPAMAQDATPVDDCAMDPAVPGTSKLCHGWLQGFKKATLQLPCRDMAGQATNCWDVIDSIEIHAYARSAGAVKKKLRNYYEAFQEDFQGTNGRKKKTLWLTEVAMGSNNGTLIVQFVDELMRASDGLTNRTLFGYLEKVSWFSDWNFDAFALPEEAYTPAQDEKWSSSAFNPFGTLSVVGQRFFSHCAAQCHATAKAPSAVEAVAVI